MYRLIFSGLTLIKHWFTCEAFQLSLYQTSLISREFHCGFVGVVYGVSFCDTLEMHVNKLVNIIYTLSVIFMYMVQAWYVQ